MTNDWGGVSREDALIEPEQVTNEDLLILWNMLWDIHSQNDGIGRNLEVMMMFVPGCYTGPHLCRFFPFLVVDSNAFFRANHIVYLNIPQGQFLIKDLFTTEISNSTVQTSSRGRPVSAGKWLI